MHGRLWGTIVVGFVLLVAACSSSGSSAGSATTTSPLDNVVPATEERATAAAAAELPSEGETIDYEDTQAFIEFNAADEDLGFHVEFGGEPWATATINGPDGMVVFDLRSGGSLTQHGLAGVFFESGEYGFDEVTRDEFLARFPEGEYTFRGETVEGEILTGVSDFTHLVPDAPVISSPTEDATIDPGAVTVAWEPVTTPAGVEPEVYSLQLYPVDPPEGEPPIDLNVDYTLEVPQSVTEIRIPPEILMPGADYEFELMVIDAAGNQTFAVGSFTTTGEPA